MKILLIEDDPKTCALLKKRFTEELYDICTESNGEQGYHMACAEDFDLLILDRMLPGMDGLTIIKKLRENNITLPIICLTAKDTINDRVIGLESGADDYLVKPFSFAELLARVRVHLRRQPLCETPVLALEDLCVDMAKHTVERAGKPIILTKKEFDLLVLLLKRRGQVFSRVQILEHIWDINFDTDTNVIDVAIKRLRDKVDRGFKTALIKTVRGVGYKIG